MRPGIKRIALIGVLIVICLLALAAAGLAVLSQRPETLRPVLESALAPAGGRARVGGIDLGIFPPELTLDRVVIEPPAAQGWRLSLDKLYWRPAWRRMMAGGRWLGRVEVQGPRFDLSPEAGQETRAGPEPVGLEIPALVRRVERVVIREGRLGLDTPAGRLSLADLSLLPDDSADGAWRLEAGLVLAGPDGEILARAELGGRLFLKAGPALRAEVTVTAAAGDLAWLSGRVDGRLAAEAAVEVGRGRLDLGPISLTARKLALLPGGQTLPDLELFFRPVLEPSGRLTVREARLALAGLGELAGRGSYDQGALDLSLEGRDLALARAAEVLQPLTGWDPKTWQLGGAADLALAASGPAGAPRLSLKAAIREASLTSPDGEIMAGKLAGSLTGNFGLIPGAGGEPAALSLAVSGGEYLLSTLYFNLSQNPLELSLRGEPQQWSSWRNLRIVAEWRDFGRMSAQGSAAWRSSGPAFDGKIELEQAALPRLWAALVRDPLALSQPDLADSKASGTARLTASLKGEGGNWRVEGGLALKHAGLRLPALKSELSGLELDLPFAYGWGVAGNGNQAPSKWGSLRLGRLRSPLIELAEQRLSLALVPGRLVVRDPLALPLWGGRVIMRDLEVFAPLSPQWEARLGVRVRNLDLAQASSEYLPLQGTLGGNLPRVVVNAQRLAAQGALNGKVFQGKVAVRDLLVLRPLEMGREIGADLEMALLDLHQLSSALGIGLITGRISGSIQGLRVAYGQPVSFKLRVESVKMKNVEQKVSLKAVNSIAVLGTGSGLSGAGVSLVTSIMNEFPYRAIGFQCTLQNDVFKINGLIQEDGVEYIVRKPFLAGINVINRNPDNYISFKDMLERLRRVVRPAGKQAGQADKE